MKYIFSLIIVLFGMKTETLFDFNSEAKLEAWYVVNDTVMGGVSSSKFSLNSEGYGWFRGNVSVENNGGFASVRYTFAQKDVSDFNQIRIRLKGDKKNYQLRVKSATDQYYSYVTSFETNGKWEEVLLDLDEMYPTFRGRKLAIPNYSNKNGLAEVCFLIANKKNEPFELFLDKIELIK